MKQFMSNSHKGQNGILYIVAGSKQYHGSLWYAVETASHFVDLIYVETDTTNLPLLKKLKQLHPALIPVSSKQRSTYLAKSTALLLGPGLGRSSYTAKLVRSVLRHPGCPKPRVIDADALHYLRVTDVTGNTIITPHAGEYRALFGKQKPLEASRSWPGIILKKGPSDAICQNGRCEYNTGGNAGLTKGGSGDVLAALAASLASTQTTYSAAVVASAVVKRAAQQLARRSGTWFSINDLINQLPYALQSCLKKSSS